MTEKLHSTNDAPDEDAKLPHDRDESPPAPHGDGQGGQNRKPIEQAHADVESGQKDTERYGTPSDVPSKADNAR